MLRRVPSRSSRREPSRSFSACESRPSKCGVGAAGTPRQRFGTRALDHLDHGHDDLLAAEYLDHRPCQQNALIHMGVQLPERLDDGAVVRLAVGREPQPCLQLQQVLAARHLPRGIPRPERRLNPELARYIEESSAPGGPSPGASPVPGWRSRQSWMENPSRLWAPRRERIIERSVSFKW